MKRGNIKLLLVAVIFFSMAALITFQLSQEKAPMELERVTKKTLTSFEEATNSNITYNQNYQALLKYYRVIPKIDENVTDPIFWIEALEKPHDILMNPVEISEFNKRNINTYYKLVDIKNIENQISRRDLTLKIREVSEVPDSSRYNTSGRRLNNTDYAMLKAKLNLGAIEDENEVKFGLSWKRTQMKAFPLQAPIYTEPGDYEFDIFMETAIYPLEPMAIYHESLDGEWYFVQIYNYTGWVPKKDIAIADKEDIFRYIDHDNFLVVITAQMELEVDSQKVLYDMGVKVPIASNYNGDYHLGILPSRLENGQLKMNYVSIPRDHKVHVGHMPYTRANIIRQAFEFHGERYGWGGMFNARDCSAFIMDIYRSFGINLPRNASQQGRKSYGVFHSPSQLVPGTPIYMVGHTMLYLGQHNGEHYMIHDFAGFYRRNSKGEFEYERVMRVLVTPLSIHSSKGRTFRSSLYNGRDFLLTD